MILSGAFTPSGPRGEAAVKIAEGGIEGGGFYYGGKTQSGRRVTPETSKQVATAYRCGDIISNDIAAMPYQLIRREGGTIQHVEPDSVVRNIPYLLEVRPNRWMVPLIFKKAIQDWLLFWGNAYIWEPMQRTRELFILRADRTTPVFDPAGNIWYEHIFPNGKKDYIPAVEIAHLMINSSDGLIGRSVLTYARETVGRQLANHGTANKISGAGLAPTGALYFNGEMSEAARKKAKQSYLDGTSGEEGEAGVVVFDNKITKFETITIKPVDAQFLETIQATDADIANFFGLPLYKLNSGKQSYQSNEQNDLDYLKTTLNPYLVQWEQVGRVKWLPAAEQGRHYFRFNRDAFLRTDAKTRTEVLSKRIETGQMSPNEAREKEDLSGYPGGDARYIPANWREVGSAQADSAIKVGLA